VPSSAPAHGAITSEAMCLGLVDEPTTHDPYRFQAKPATAYMVGPTLNLRRMRHEVARCLHMMRNGNFVGSGSIAPRPFGLLRRYCCHCQARDGGNVPLPDVSACSKLRGRSRIYSITSSARASRNSRIVMASHFAVLRLRRRHLASHINTCMPATT
jgi:hypothetical protein